MKQLLLRLIVTALVCALIVSVWGCSGDSGSGDPAKDGMKAFSDGHYSDARGLLIKALEKKPSDKSLLYFTGLAYKRDYILDSAFYYIKRVDLLYPNDREVLEQLFEVASMLGEHEAARKAIMDLVQLGDPLEKHIENLVDMLYKSGSITNLYYYLVKWYREYGLEDAGRFRMLASYAAKVDSFEVAHQVLDSAITRWGESDDFELVRSQIMFEEGDLAGAEKILRVLVEKYPENKEFKINLASALSNQRQLPKIDEALGILNRLRPELPDPTGLDSMIISIEGVRESVVDQ